MNLKKIIAPIFKMFFYFVPYAHAFLSLSKGKAFWARQRWRILQRLEINGKVNRKDGCRPSVYHYWRMRYKYQNSNKITKAIAYLENKPNKPTFIYFINPHTTNILMGLFTILSIRRQSYKKIKIILSGRKSSFRALLFRGISGPMLWNGHIDPEDFILNITLGDRLYPHALLEIGLSVVDTNKECDIAYFDEDTMGLLGRYRFPFFKPDYSPIYCDSIDYISGACVFRARLLEGNWADEWGDIKVPSLTNIPKEKICHISEIILHKRHTRTISFHVEKSNPKNIQENLVSIIIPTRDNVQYLETCVESIFKKTTSTKFQIIIVNNRSEKQETIQYLRKIAGKNGIKVLNYPYEFNYSAINNFAVQHADGNDIVFLNNDTEVITGDWLQRIEYWLNNASIGCVGAKLLYSDQTIQHVGAILGAGMGACHFDVGDSQYNPGYFGVNMLPREISVVTGACMGIRKDTFLKIGGFDEQMPVSYNDVELCIRLKNSGYVNIIDPRIILYHFESKSRGYDDNDFKRLRAKAERNYFLKKAKFDVRFDPYYNPNLSLKNTYCLSFPPRTISRIKMTTMHSRPRVILLGSNHKQDERPEIIMLKHAELLSKKGYRPLVGMDKKMTNSIFRNFPRVVIGDAWDAADMIMRMYINYVITYSDLFNKIAWEVSPEIKVFHFHEETPQEKAALDADTLEREAAESYGIIITSIDEFIECTRTS